MLYNNEKGAYYNKRLHTKVATQGATQNGTLQVIGTLYLQKTKMKRLSYDWAKRLSYRGFEECLKTRQKAETI